MILKGLTIGRLHVDPQVPLSGNGIVRIGNVALDRREVEELVEVLRELLDAR